MSHGRFGNEYLAESVGFATGRAHGIAKGAAAGWQKGYDLGYKDGHNDGYNKGWSKGNIDGQNKVVAEANPLFVEKNDLIANLQAQLDALKIVLKRKNEEHEQTHVEALQLGQLQQEQAKSLRAEYEQVHMAFLGLVAIATPLMNVFAKLPLEEKERLMDGEYGKLAVQLQSREYINANRFPHNQPLIVKYMPIASQVFNQAGKQIQAERAWRKQQEEYQEKFGAERPSAVAEGT